VPDVVGARRLHVGDDLGERRVLDGLSNDLVGQALAELGIGHRHASKGCPERFGSAELRSRVGDAFAHDRGVRDRAEPLRLPAHEFAVVSVAAE